VPSNDSSPALLLYLILRDYHDVAQSLKYLRTAQHALWRPSWIVERHRVRATGWFNRIALLSGRLTDRELQLVASPDAARLWLAYVLPLDRAVRRRAHGDASMGRRSFVEVFWSEYATGRVLRPTSQE